MDIICFKVDIIKLCLSSSNYIGLSYENYRLLIKSARLLSESPSMTFFTLAVIM